jgi:hypothetical protein
MPYTKPSWASPNPVRLSVTSFLEMWLAGTTRKMKPWSLPNRSA